MVVPVGIFSALLGHGIVGKPFSVLSVWGVVALVGILVNDAVVMLDQYNKNLDKGMEIKEAVLKAGKSRFRAIILTTITTVAGLYPLILEKSFQSQFLIPMAISVAYGVLFGTIILLLASVTIRAAVDDDTVDEGDASVRTHDCQSTLFRSLVLSGANSMM